MTLQLASPAFAPGARIPARYSCDGEDLSPPLAWRGVPAEAKSLALFCDDPDAPFGTWRHWAVFDLPPTLAELPEGYPRNAAVEGVRQAVNDFRVTGYRGPARREAMARTDTTSACWLSTWRSCRSETMPDARRWMRPRGRTPSPLRS